MRRLRAAVVGAGHVGRQHARIYAGMAQDGVELAAVVDLDPARTREVAGRHGGRALESCEQLDADVDLASVCVPTRLHREVAAPLIERGVAVLVRSRSPPRSTRRALRRWPARWRLPAGGHAPTCAAPRRAASRSSRASSRRTRLAPFSFRSTDVGVVHDLMIHDLDIVLHLIRSPLKEVRAVGGALLSPHEDIANARLEFEDGAVANLTASRVSLAPMRRTRVFSRDLFLSLDFGKKHAFLARRPRDFDARLAQQWERIAATPDEELPSIAATAFRGLIEFEELALDDEEPLQAELASFVRAVRTGSPPEVSADEALRALEAAAAVLDQILSRPW
jgi:predicted dehydrogenase